MTAGPDNEFETRRFSVATGAVCFEDDPDGQPAVDEETRVFCDKCSWHGCLREISGG